MGRRSRPVDRAAHRLNPLSAILPHRGLGRGVNGMLRAPLLGAIILTSLVFCIRPAAAGVTSDCHIGSYRLSDGTALDIAPSDDGTLRWRTFTGETGQLHRQK